MNDIRADTSKFDRMMSDIPGALARAQERALQAIGAAVASRATRAFRSEPLRPAPWAPRKDKKAKHPLLIKSGSLRQSISWRVTAPDTVQIGSDKKYASYHQEGTKNMPARPFFPVDKNGRLVPEMERKINRTVEKVFTDELKKIGG